MRTRSRAAGLGCLAALLGTACADRAPAPPATPAGDTAGVQEAAPRAGSAPAPARLPSFSGDLRNPGEARALEAFLLKHRQGPGVVLHLRLSDEQVRDLRSVGSDRFWINLTYQDEAGNLTGSELNLLSPEARGRDGQRLVVLDPAEGDARLDARLAVQDVLGPQQGITSILARPAP